MRLSSRPGFGGSRFRVLGILGGSWVVIRVPLRVLLKGSIRVL